MALAEIPANEALALDALQFAEVREALGRHASFSASRALALELEPVRTLDEAQRLQDETSEALRLPSLRPSLNMGGVHDVRPALHRAQVGGVLGPPEMLDIASTARAARNLRRGLLPLASDLPALTQIASAYLSDHTNLPEDIQQAIGEGGDVLDTASPALRAIRAELRGAHDRLVARLRDIMGSPSFRDVVQDPVVTQRSGRYVIPIRAEARGQVNVLVHDQSASGATLFVEPLATVEMGNRWRTLQADEQREVDRILRALSEEIGARAPALRRSVEGLAVLDLALARAHLAEEQKAAPPTLVSLPRQDGEPVLRLINARHPLLRGRVVPMSLELGKDFDVLVITGPNTGGKTVALKTAGLLVLMAQSGLHIPADEGSIVGVFEQVRADIGDEQSLQQSLSTFSSHITRIVRMLDAGDRCLILLDELGAGTDPQEGSALARALLAYLQQRGAFVIATSHYAEVKAYAQVTPRVENASVEFDLQTLSPTYRLSVGVAGESNALAIAARLGLPEDIVERARANVSPERAEMESLLGKISRERAEAQDARARALKEAAEAARLKIEARQTQREVEKLRRTAWERAQEEARGELEELRREALRVREDLRRGASHAETRQAVQKALGLELPQPVYGVASEAGTGSHAQAVPAVGSSVTVPHLNLPGRVVSVRDGMVELDVLGRRVRASLTVLTGAAPAPPDKTPPAAPPPAPPAAPPSLPTRDVSLQLDLRGLRREEALENLQTYLEEASEAGLPHASIVHGKGTGTIRQAVREALRASSLVQRYESERDAGGGDGATAVWFKP